VPFTIEDNKGAGKDAVAPGTYKGILEKVSIAYTADGKEYRMWDFMLDVNGVLTPLSDTSSMNNGPKGKTYQWLTALTGRAPKVGETIEDPIGKQVLVTVGRKESGWPKIDMLTAYVEPAQTEAGIPR